MARPRKTGLDYFNVDCEFFSNKKIRRLLRAAGSNGVMVYTSILCDIYRGKGYYIDFNSDSIFYHADMLNMEEKDVNTIIKQCVDFELFNPKLFAEKQILTSAGIQNRYSKICKEAKKIFDIIPEYTLITSEETPVTSEETPVTSEETPVTSGISTQSKVKKSKVKENKENNLSILERERDEILKIFFFEKMFISPPDEVTRFVNHYTATGWRNKNNSEIVDRVAVARCWAQDQKKVIAKPLDFNFVYVWKNLYAAVWQKTRAEPVELLRVYSAEFSSSRNGFMVIVSQGLCEYLDASKDIIMPIYNKLTKHALIWNIKH